MPATAIQIQACSRTVAFAVLGVVLNVVCAHRLLAGEVAPADLVFRNGTIVTLDEKLPQASALAARGGRIVAVGGDEAVKPLTGPRTRVIDLAGRSGNILTIPVNEIPSVKVDYTIVDGQVVHERK